MNEVEINPKKCGGKPVITGTRIPVTVILDQFEAGADLAEVLRKFPELVEGQVVAAIRYCRELIDHTELESLAV